MTLLLAQHISVYEELVKVIRTTQKEKRNIPVHVPIKDVEGIASKSYMSLPEPLRVLFLTRDML
jgi:hypothetical protein